jgi:hypothetical protein
MVGIFDRGGLVVGHARVEVSVQDQLAGRG